VSETIKLPASSYAELKKFIQCYFVAANGQIDKPVSYEDAAGQGAIQKTTLSANNGFLESFGLVTSPKRGLFALTKHGRDIALSVSNKEFEIELALRAWIRSNSFFKKILNSIKVRQGFDIENLKSFIIVSSGAKRNKSTVAGANAILDILKQSGLVRIDGSRISVDEALYNELNDELPSISTPDQTVIYPILQPRQSVSELVSETNSLLKISVEIKYNYDPNTAQQFLEYLDRLKSNSSDQE
jgi:hypothetical protein